MTPTYERPIDREADLARLRAALGALPQDLQAWEREALVELIDTVARIARDRPQEIAVPMALFGLEVARLLGNLAGAVLQSRDIVQRH